MAVIGAGMGLMASQIGNVNLSSVGERDTSEVGGLQGTAQNLGTALGTALIGSILLTTLLASFDNKIEANPAIPAKAQSQIEDEDDEGDPVRPRRRRLGGAQAGRRPRVGRQADRRRLLRRPDHGPEDGARRRRGDCRARLLGHPALPTEPLAPTRPTGAVATV